MNQHSRLFLRVGFSAAVVLPLVLTSACTVQSDKSSDGSNDNVKISTPLGGMKVRSNEVDAASLGLPAYPGAHILTKKENGENNDGSVDLHMGFGPWQMWVQVVSYGSTDAQDKVMAFYRKALAGQYGDVIECSGDKTVGSPSVTSQGLSCDEHGQGKHVNVDYDRDVELKAGSKRHQHIVGFKKGDSGETKFALVNLELPNTDSEKETN